LLAGLKAEDAVANDIDLMSSQKSERIEHAKDILRKNSGGDHALRQSRQNNMVKASTE